MAVQARSEESDFNAFLNRISGSSHSGTSVAPTAAPVNEATVVLPQAGASDTATVAYQKDEFDTDPTAHESLTQAALKRRKKAKKKPKQTP